MQKPWPSPVPARLAEPELLSDLREEMQTYTEGQGKKGKSVISPGGGADALQLPAVVTEVQFIEYFENNYLHDK